MRYITQEEQELYKKIMEKNKIEGYSFYTSIIFHKPNLKSRVSKREKARAKKSARKK